MSVRATPPPTPPATAPSTDTAKEGYVPSRLSAAGMRAGFVPKWQPSTAYTAGEVLLSPSGQAVSANSSFTSGATYSAANWTAVSLDARYSVPVLRPIGSGAQPSANQSPTPSGALTGGTGVKRLLSAVPVQSILAKWGNFEVGGQEAHTTATTLSAAATAAATTITTAASVPVGVALILDTGTLAEPVQTTAVTGAGPYTVTLSAATKNAHASGSAVSIMYGDLTIVAAALEYPSGTVIPLAFNGASGAVVKPGQIATCDELAVAIPANTPFWVRTYMTWPAGSNVPLHPMPVGNGQSSSLSATPSDKTWQTGGNVGADTVGPSPVAVLGRVAATNVAIAFVGDSITNGTGDYPDQSRGYTGMATDGVVAAQKVTGPGGRAMYDAVPAGRWRKWRLIPGCTCAYEAYGINDISAASQTLAQVQASKLTVWSALRAIPGIRSIYTATLVPFTASTDGWMTAVNQSISNATFETIRTGLNNWVRDGAPVASAANLTAVATGTAGALRAGGAGHPLSGYVDVADTVEANAAGALTRNGGRWYAPGTIRTVTDAAITAGTKILTSATAAFTAADVGTVVAVNGAGAAGGVYAASISVVTSGTQVTLAPQSGANATTTVSGATAKIGGWTPDGTHPGTLAHAAMAPALTAALPALTA